MNKMFTSLNPPEMITEDIKFFNIKFELTLADKDLLGKVEGKNQIWGGKGGGGGGSVAWEGGSGTVSELKLKILSQTGVFRSAID